MTLNYQGWLLKAIGAGTDAAPYILETKNAGHQGTPVETAVPVLITSTLVLAANANRTYLMIQNQDAANPIWVSCDGLAAVADATCTKIAAGGSLIFENGYIPTGIINAIATGGTVNTHVREGS